MTTEESSPRDARRAGEAAAGPVRRRMLGGLLAAGGATAGAVLLTSCYIPSEDPPGGAGPDSGTAPGGKAPGDSAEDSPGGSGSGSGGGDGAAPQGDPLVSSDQVPGGGGVVLADREIVVTRDASGTVRAFSAVCTHAGCLVDSVSGGTINCPCHGSAFDAGTGSPVSGPAGAPLSPVPVQEIDGGVFPA
ncbi:Rieske (2Fe-2S) protein [Streptomyces aidingensis]|uniref:Cytochrome bc1 complex Rieske iron-sulfur subunit n=1 Tax=Streptomyces aidingensis TaxID=910347 RepID=A0A1I1MY90_9ACTN|nr:Rieske (2Fe-2S) protein [Streptomyces aidingensis]SFC90125.1 Ferredoxin subunit of nitrite reductase or a ring-hydroxylating dioxygenase [Streptomyces aidingensis]